MLHQVADQTAAFIRGETGVIPIDQFRERIVRQGPELDTLYVTSAVYSAVKRDMTGQKNPGGLFAISGLGVKGLPLVPFKG